MSTNKRKRDVDDIVEDETAPKKSTTDHGQFFPNEILFRIARFIPHNKRGAFMMLKKAYDWREEIAHLEPETHPPGTCTCWTCYEEHSHEHYRTNGIPCLCCFCFQWRSRRNDMLDDIYSACLREADRMAEEAIPDFCSEDSEDSEESDDFGEGSVGYDRAKVKAEAFYAGLVNDIWEDAELSDWARMVKYYEFLE